jgi:hypothetical protein
LLLEALGQIGHHHLPDLIPGVPVQDQAKGSVRVVLADQNHRAMKERALELPSVEK